MYVLPCSGICRWFGEVQGLAERISSTRTLLQRNLEDPTSLCMHCVGVCFGGHVLLQVV